MTALSSIQLPRITLSNAPRCAQDTELCVAGLCQSPDRWQMSFFSGLEINHSAKVTTDRCSISVDGKALFPPTAEGYNFLLSLMQVAQRHFALPEDTGQPCHRIAAQKVWLWTAKEAQLTPTPQKGTQQWILCQPAASCTLQRTAWGCLLNNVRLWFKGMMVVCLQRNQRTNEESPC